MKYNVIRVMHFINTSFMNITLSKEEQMIIRFIPRQILFLFFFISCSVVGEPQLNGVATHTELGEEQFVVGLYATNYSNSSREILDRHNEKKIEIKITYDQLSIRRFKRIWIEGMVINLSTSELEKHADNVAKFSNMLNINLKVNDVILIQELPESLIISINDITLGHIPDPLFIDQLLRALIGNVPLSTKFKKDLLVAGNITPELLSKFKGIRPSSNRIEAIRDSIGKSTEVNAIALSSPDAVANNEEDNIASKVASNIPPSAPLASVSSVPAVSKSKKITPAVQATSVAKPIVKEVVQKTKQVKKIKATPPPFAPEKENIIDDTDIKYTADYILKEQIYYLSLAKYTQKYVRYPKVSMARGHEGSLLIRATIDRKGNVLNTAVIEETEHKALNKEALKAIKRASPYPSIPAEIEDNEFSFAIVITFGLGGNR